MANGVWPRLVLILAAVSTSTRHFEAAFASPSGSCDALAVKTIVVDQTERDLLDYEMRQHVPGTMNGGILSVHHCAEMLRQMQADTWTWQPGLSSVIICQVDDYLSATFTVFIAMLFS